MLDSKLLRDDPERVKKAIATKNADPALVDEFLKFDAEWRKLTTHADEKRAEQHKLSEKRDIEGGKKNKEEIRALEEKLAELEKQRDDVWQRIPNLPSDDTPIGKDDNDNKVIRTWGEPKKFDFEPKDHMALGEALGIVNTEHASNVAGARFTYLKGDAALLQFALIHHTIEKLTDQTFIEQVANSGKPGYHATPFVPVIPPVMIRPDVFQKMGRLEPKEERYHIPSDDLYLIGSAEHTLGPLHMNESIPEEQLPIRYLGYSTAFRREAGSYGKDTRGIIRLHQFDKLEMESFVAPEDGIHEQNFLVAIQEHLMQSLKLPYRVVMTSTGDQGDPDARHLDIETWIPSQKKYRETHSADYMGDYQARRLGTRVRHKSGKTDYVHTNDATAFAIGRTLVAILENYQTKEGKIEVPEVLERYVGKKMIG